MYFKTFFLQIQNANVCVVSVFGCGRACSFIGALYAISQLNHGIEPSVCFKFNLKSSENPSFQICEIMKDIKQHRPSATESCAQYAGIYAIVLDYIAVSFLFWMFHSIKFRTFAA